MSSNRTSTWPIIAVIVAIFVLLIDLPPSFRQWAPGFIRNADFHFGLDLAGGTQLDFRVSEDEIRTQIASISSHIDRLEQEGDSSQEIANLRIQKETLLVQQQSLMEAIRTVLERRVNALGVSEAVITPSYIGNEKHLLVECPGVVDVQTCIETVGKTIQLEFREEFTEPTEEHESKVRARAEQALRRMNESGETLSVLGQDLGDELGIAYRTIRSFRDDLPEGLAPMWNKSPESGVHMLEGSVKTLQNTPDGEREQDVPGIFLAEVVEPKTVTGHVIRDAPTAFSLLKTQEKDIQTFSRALTPLDTISDMETVTALRQMKPGDLKVVSRSDGNAAILFLRQYIPPEEEMEASHILVAYRGASAADEGVKRSKTQALEKAKEIKGRLSAGADFESTARKESDGPSAKDGGSLGVFGRGVMVKSFEDALLALKEEGISDPVETQFGFHIIRLDRAPHRTPDEAKYEELIASGPNAIVRANTFLSDMQKGQITRQEELLILRMLFFSFLPTGWKDTQLDGKHFRAATVTLDPITNIPVVQIMFDEEGGRIFQELTRQNIDKRIAIFVGGELVSAPTVQQEIAGGIAVITGSKSFDEAKRLAQDLNTGAIPAPIHLSGQRTVEATLGAESLKTSIQAALIGMIILMIYITAVYRFPGAIASGALVIYTVIFLAILKLPLFLFSSQFIVLTLAGMAGIILSIGMAVDANILIFERMKEELKKGKMLKTAVETGFERAWPSIRDSNISTIITCIILFLIGTSIVRGFAVTLGTGVLISMFTAIVITRRILRRVADTDLANRPWLFLRPPPSVATNQ